MNISRKTIAALQILLFCTAMLPQEGWAEVKHSVDSFAASPVFGGGLALPGLTLSPSVALPGWAFHGGADKSDVGADGWRGFSLRATSSENGAILNGRAKFQEAPGGALHAQWRIVPSADADIMESSVATDIPGLVGGCALLDGRPIHLAIDGAKPHIFRGAVTNISILKASGEEILRCLFDRPTRILLQDGAYWGGANLTLRLYFSEGPVKAGVEYAIDATLSSPAAGPLVLGPEQKYRLVAGSEWTTLKYDPWIEPGSALDFTGVIPHHSPAGKFGRVVTVGDHFEFEGLPGVPQRFYGVNLCGTANLPESREEADRFAANLARIGYNAVRIHHHERWLVSKDGKLPESAASFSDTALDPAQMDKFDFLVAACVEHGLYITTDLFVSRSHVVPWRALGIDRDGSVDPRYYKILVAFHEPAFSNLCAWAKTFLGHVNPYTGRSLAQEPALCALALVNEGNLGNYGAGILRDTPGVAEAWGKPIPIDLNDPAFASFLAERETNLFKRLRAFVRDECGCAAPLSSLSAWYNPIQYQLVRTHFDYVDDHFYVDHPKFLDRPWRLPTKCANVNPLLGLGKGAQAVEWHRLMDKPFCITEFNYCGPGRFRGVGGIAAGALAALQNWSGLWRFTWSHSRDGIVRPGGRIGYFDVANDPLFLAAERAGLCLFLRRDLEPLEEERPAVFDEAAIRNPEKGKVAFPGPDQPLSLGWEAKVGTRVVKGAVEEENASEGNREQSDAIDNNVTISQSGTMLIATPRTAGGFAESGAHQAGPLKFEITASSVSRSFDSSKPVAATPVAATVWASSLDGEPLASSRHILVTHLTDVQNDGMEYADKGLTILLSSGKSPHIMRNGCAEISLTLAADSACVTSEDAIATVYRLSSSGKRLGEVPATWDHATGGLSFTARTNWDPAAATYLYEIVR